MSDRKQIFRKVALDRLSSPEQLDLLVHVVTPRAWLLWLPLFGIVAGALLWSLFGSVSTVVSGRAILLQRGGLAEISSAAQGRVEDIVVGVGGHVDKGQTVATLAQPELAERLHQAQDRLAELQRREAVVTQLGNEGGSISAASLAQQRNLLQQQQHAAEERTRLLEERVTTQTTLLEQGLITRQTLLNTQNQLTAARLETEATRGQIQQLALKGLENRKESSGELSQIRLQVADAGRAVEQLAAAQRQTTVVASPYAGRVVEVRVATGTVVTSGTPLVTVEPDGASADGLEAAIYLSAADGKKVRPGMLIEIAPATVRREEYGYLIGAVSYVSDYPATPQSMHAILQNDDLVRELSGASPPIELRARLTRADTASGYRWSSSQGPPVKVTAGTPAQADVVVLQQRPLTLLIPALRQWLGAP